jgi:hypothetical protein
MFFQILHLLIYFSLSLSLSFRISDEVGTLCSKGHDIMASLIPALEAASAKALLPHDASSSSSSSGGGEGGAAMSDQDDIPQQQQEDSTSSLIISNRALRAEVSTLKDTVLRLARQAAIDKAVTLQAQRSSHQSERMLHLHLANKSISMLPSEGLNPLLATPALPQVEGGTPSHYYYHHHLPFLAHQLSRRPTVEPLL